MQSWQRTLYILAAAQFVSAIGFGMFFPFLSLYAHELGSETGTSLEFWIGLAFSGQALAMAITAPIWGMLADRYGRKPMVERAMYGGALVILLMGFVQSAEQLALLRAVQGAITGTIAAMNALVAAIAPRERMGYAMGMNQMALWSGIAAGPLLGGVTADLLGFRLAFGITALLLLIAGIVTTFGVREEFTPPEPGKQRPGVLSEWRTLLLLPGVLPAYVVRFTAFLGPTMLLPVLPLIMQELLHGSNAISTFTGLVVGISSAAGTASALYFGRLGDRIGHRRIVITCAVAAALLFVPQFFVAEAWQLLVLQGLTGAATGALGPSVAAMLARYTPTGEAGVVYGLDSSITSASRAIAPLLGAGIAVWLGFRGPLLGCAVVMGIAALIAWLTLRDRPVASITPVDHAAPPGKA